MMPSICNRSRRRDPRAGQALLFLALALVILAFVVLWVFDLHKVLYVKARARNAGDAAALAAARWQGITLNLVGELNLLQAVALAEALVRGEDVSAEAEAIADLQARLCFAGPMAGLAAAQQAAKNNRIYVNEAFSSRLLAHAIRVRQDYPVQFLNPPYRNDPEPPTCWDDYAFMLEGAALEGLAAFPENMRLYRDFVLWAHPLLNPDFYDAVASRDWCWFHFHAANLLEHYSGWLDWPALPVIEEPEPVNAEIFGLGLRRVLSLDRLPPLPGGGGWPALLAEWAGGLPAVTGLVSVAAQWQAYHPSLWSRWQDRLGPGFPFDGEIRPEYDVTGADAVVRIETGAGLLSPGSAAPVLAWTAAAKPFGSIEGGLRPDQYGLVLPVFTDVRLIPIDASSSPAGGSRPGWMEHIREHLPAYLEQGSGALSSGCWYCAQLRRWDNVDLEDGPRFQQEGIEWLALFSHTCSRPGGPGPGGGSRVGH